LIKKPLLQELLRIVGPENVLSTPEAMAYASKDMATSVLPKMPALVLLVHTREELIRATKACLEHGQALVVRGAGTGKSGGATPDADCVVIDISKLNRIIAIHKAGLLAELEPGVILSDFQRAVDQEGLFYPPDPASVAMCTIGGNVAENAGGPSTFKYGSTREYLLGGQAILGTGEVVDFGKRCMKGVAGYDLASLLCGSEGTLAVFCSFIVRLLPKPKDRALALFLFAKDEDALDATQAVFAGGFRPRSMEYIDSTCLEALLALGFKAIGEEACSALMIECDASVIGAAVLELKSIAHLMEQWPKSRAILAEGAARDEIFTMRKSLSEACSKYLGHKLSEDIAVPLSAIAEFGRWFKAQEQKGLKCGLFGHAGDGNLHVQIMFKSAAHQSAAEALRHQVLLQVLKKQGTLSAEHGIGLQKKDYLALEQSKALIELQKRIKSAFDPHGLLNPGKIFAS
jgi:glycolate oxidase